MTTVFQQHFVCGCCRYAFDDAVIGSCGYASKDSDFRPNYWGMNPLPYFIHSCPRCGYTAYDIGSIPPAGVQGWLLKGGMQFVLTQLETSIRQEAQRYGNESGWQKYLQAVLCAEQANSDALKIADLFLHMAWTARSEEAFLAERYAQQRALHYFRQAFEAELVPGDLQPEVLYLIGELYRRLSEFEQAQARLEAAIDAAVRRDDTDLTRLARHQYRLAHAGNAGNAIIGEETDS